MTAEQAQEWTQRGAFDDYIDENVFVDDSKFLSNMKIRGKGLYAARDFRKNEYIQEYLGKMITDQEAERKTKNTNYMFDVKGKRGILFVLDGAQKRYSSAARYVNAANKLSQQNSYFKQVGDRIMLRALKRIPKYNEIIGWYGPDTHRVIKQH